MIGVSRIYLGVHYASDVLGGFCASLVWLVVYTRIAAPRCSGSLPRHGVGVRGADASGGGDDASLVS